MNLGHSVRLILASLVLAGLMSPRESAQTSPSEPSISDIVTSADSIVLVPLRSEDEIKSDIKTAATRKEESEARRALVTTQQSTIGIYIREQERAIEAAEQRLEQAEETEVEADITTAEKDVTAARTVLDLLELQQDLTKAEFRQSIAEVKFYSATLAILELEEMLAALRRKQLQTIEKAREGEETSLVTAEIHALEGKVLKATSLRVESRSELADSESDLVDAREELYEKRAELLGLGREEEKQEEEDGWD
ncbi:MAG: hypothetical protein WBG01_04710 [Bacteroidota bacterium]